MMDRVRWRKDAPDHWSCEVDERFTLAAWPRMDGSWEWELFDHEVSEDEPVERGSSMRFVKAKRYAEEAAEARRTEDQQAGLKAGVSDPGEIR